MSTQATVPMFDPQGNVRNIPSDQVDAATQAGGRRAVQMPDPKGTLRYIPEDQINNAVAASPDDPNGNYDFGDLGKVQGMRMNGRPATRQEAFGQLAYQRSTLQTMADSAQSNIQANRNTVQSMMDPDQQMKDAMGDMAGMLVGEGLGSAGKLLKGVRWSEGADALSGLVRSYAPKPARNAVGKLLGVAPGALEQQTSPTVFRQFGQEYHMPVSGPPPGPRAGAPPILTPQDAATQREGGTAASLPFLKGLQKQPPASQQVAEQPSATAQTPPSPESAPVASPVDPKQFYGKTPTRSNLRANQRQLASPTGSTAPIPTPTEGPHPPDIMKILNAPGDISDADLATVQNYFAKQKFTNMLLGNALQKAAGQ